MGSSLTVPVEHKRSIPHPHYSLEIKSFSSLSSLGEYKSDVFEAGGYSWSLSLYPKGDKDNNGSGYISFYLSIEETDERPDGWEVYVNYNLFVYDRNRDKYRTIQDADGPVKKFHKLKTRWGFPRFLSLRMFEVPSNGYLVNDSCVFGADVLVIEPPRKVESFDLNKFKQPGNTFTQQIPNFSQLHEMTCYSATIGESKWELRIYPKGNGAEKGKSLSLYLKAQDLPPKRKVYVEFKLCLLDQLNSNHKEEKVSGWLSASAPSKGCPAFMPLEDLQSPEKGFIKEDALTVEVQILAMSTVSVGPV